MAALWSCRENRGVSPSQELLLPEVDTLGVPGKDLEPFRSGMLVFLTVRGFRLVCGAAGLEAFPRRRLSSPSFSFWLWREDGRREGAGADEVRGSASSPMRQATTLDALGVSACRSALSSEKMTFSFWPSSFSCERWLLDPFPE